MSSTMIIRITGIAQLLLGVMIWMGNAGGLIPVHMLIGLIFVIAMWILGFRAMRAGVSPVLAGIVLLWGAAILALGMTQAQLMPGANHAAIQILHVVTGLIGMGLSEAVGKRMRIAAGA
ncbi:MAG TPA: hypothetical protein VJX91_05365 [Candidatus Eisenbacteria bacterium]|nr:hypothetical protein [Candidatus Eisenbacteria bacterium]